MSSPHEPDYIEKTFVYHPPKDEDQINRYSEIRGYGKDFAEVLLEFCPESAERTLALRKIQEAVMWANASIAINE